MPATNLFWLKAILRYVGETADASFLRAIIPTIEAAGGFLLAMLPPPAEAEAGQPRLLRTSGALMIDVFKRGNYTTDANALAVDVFSRLARMYAYLRQDQQAATCTAAGES
eukprot:SAG22_NODE_70_length_22717_cov_12.413741_1_plen_111_part_00